MIESATAINSLPSHVIQADFVPPQITIPSSLLKDLLGTVQDLKEEVAVLREEQDKGREEMAAMRLKLAALETTEEQDVNRICLDIAFDRQRISRLENPIKDPGKTERSRAEKIERYLSSRPDHRATFETLKGYLGIDKDLLNDAIKTLMNSAPGR